MTFVTSYWFRIELLKPSIIDLIARTPPEFYFLVPDGTWVYGMLVSDDVMEFLINELTVKSLEIVPVTEVRKIHA